MPSPRDDAVSAITPPLRPLDRVTIRRRLPDGSATDVVGWVQAVSAERVELLLDPQTPVGVDRAQIILARRVPPARGGPDPMSRSAVALQQLALPAWVDHTEPLGDWTLRSADGFTRRANSCLAVGDPGLDDTAAAAAVMDFYRAHGQTPVVQVVDGEPPEQAFRALGWVTGGPETDLMVIRLAALIGDDAPASTEVVLDEELDEPWLAGLLHQRGLSSAPAAGRRVLAGPAPVVFAEVLDDGAAELVAMARGQVGQDWLGITAVWTRPDRRRQGLAADVMRAIARWAALRGARYCYLQVAHDNAPAQAAYTRLGFQLHHAYRYLQPGPAG